MLKRTFYAYGLDNLNNIFRVTFLTKEQNNLHAKNTLKCDLKVTHFKCILHSSPTKNDMHIIYNVN